MNSVRKTAVSRRDFQVSQEQIEDLRELEGTKFASPEEARAALEKILGKPKNGWTYHA